MTVYKHGNGFRAEIWIGGKRLARKSGFTTAKKARLWRDENKSLIITGEYQKKDMTWDELVQIFKSRHYPTIRENTVKFYDDFLDNRLSKYLNYRSLTALKPGTFEDLRSKLMNDPFLGVTSVNNHMTLVKQVLNKAVEWGYLQSNPLKLKPLKKEAASYRWWSDRDDIERFLKRTKTARYHLAYRIALETGMRLGEIVGLNVDDIDIGRGVITVDKTWLAKQRKLGPPKHNKPRWIKLDLDGELLRDLGEYIDGRVSGPLFITALRTRLKPNNLAGSEQFKRYIKEAGVPEIRFHDLRHTFASWWMLERGDIWQLMGILGHSNINTTMRYSHLADSVRSVGGFSWSKTSTPNSPQNSNVISLRR